ncbi:PPA1309 family protein [Jonesia quinghaiensis]|uniref:PPA1309 family protein n=1 Tax=Jonesia quinghaiensis TaxID=262806 RepID=UPI000402ED7C|nr:PPA1309 family protein [Jonesia quinghaiensis]
MNRPHASDLPADVAALADAVSEIERHVARAGWDGDIRLFALISTRDAIAADPDVASQLPQSALDAAARDPHHLTSVEQENLPAVDSLEELLGSIVFPPTVAGCAVVTERFILPPTAEEEIPEDPTAALAYITSHPERQDVRMAVGALRSGPSWCAIRTRDNDDDLDVAHGPTLVPGLVDAVRSTLADVVV